MSEYRLGQVAGLDVSIEPRAMVGSLLLLLVLSYVAVSILHLPVGQALAGSLVAVALHWISDVVHHLGHAWVARRAGYPMIGIRLGKWALLGTSLYPPNEQALPATTHIRRALGGPVGSLLFSLVPAAAVLALRSLGGVFWWLGLFWFLDSFAVFVLGAFLPLGFTDGSTLLHMKEVQMSMSGPKHGWWWAALLIWAGVILGAVGILAQLLPIAVLAGSAFWLLAVGWAALAVWAMVGYFKLWGK